MKKSFLLLFALCTISLYNCGDDDGGSDCDLMEFASDSDANLTIGQTYVDSPTQANCDAYAADLQLIIDNYGDCESATIMTQVNAFQTALSALDCQ